MPDIASQGKKVFEALWAKTELDTNKRAVWVQRADFAFFVLAHFTDFLSRQIFYVPGSQRKPTERNLISMGPFLFFF